MTDDVTGVTSVPETKLLFRIRVFVAILFVALLNVMGLYWLRPAPQPVSLEAQQRCEAIFGLMDTLPSLPQFARPMSLQATDTPVVWMTRAMEIMDPYRVLFLQKEIHRGVREAQDHWAGFTEGHDCSWFGAYLQPLWNKANARLDAEIARHGDRYTKIKIGQVKELNIPRPMHFTLNDQEWSARVDGYATQILKAADDKLMNAFKGDRTKYVQFNLEEIAVPAYVEPETLLTKAYLSAHDPFSTFFSAAEFTDFSQELAGETTGIGIQAVRTPEGLFIQKVLPKTPAAKVLKADDTITQIEGVNLGSLTGTMSRKLLSGKEGTPLKIVYCRANKGCQAARLVRQRFAPEESKIEYELRSAGGPDAKAKVAFITIPSFYGRSTESPSEHSSADDLEAILHELLLKEQSRQIKLNGVVLDMRGNPGGYLEEAIQMASLFLGTKPVVGLREPKKSRIHWGTKHEALYNGPLVALVDRLSASAAEVLAGALKDHRRAILIGSDRTYGKGTVQKLIPLNEIPLVGAANQVFEGAAIKLTTSVFYSPKGHTPASRGVKTDIILRSARNEGGVETDYMNPPHFGDSKPFSKDGKALVDDEGNIELAGNDESSAAPLLDTQIHTLKRLAQQNKVDVKKALEEQQTDEAVEIAEELSRILNDTTLTGRDQKIGKAAR